MQYLLLRDLAIIFAGSLLVILVFHRLKLPALPGFIVAGVLLGPNALGLVSDVHQVESLAEVGVILLLFTIGIEFSLSRLREMGRQVVIGGGAQVLLTVGLAAAVAAALGLAWPVAVLVGFLVALSSTAIVLKGLADKGEIDTPHGRLATGVLIFQDLCVVPMMLVLPFLAGAADGEGGAAGLAWALAKAGLVVAGVLVLARTVVPRVLSEIVKTRSRELFLIAVILVGTLTALGTAAAGASLGLGAFLAVAVLTMLVTPFALQSGPALLDALERWIPLDRLLPGFRPQALTPVGEPLTDHVIVAGYGLNGRNLAAALRSIRAPYLIVELNAQTVRQARARGEPAFYGDATREEILRGLGAERARMLVVAISDPAATRRMVRVARALNPRIHIIARTRYVVEMPELTRLGADVVIPEEFETSIEIFARVLAHYGVPRGDIERLVEEIRGSHYEMLRGDASGRLSLEGVAGVPQMAIERMRLAPQSALAGKRLAATGLRSETGALVLSVVRGDAEIATPGPQFRLVAGDVLVVVGQPHLLNAAAKS